MQTTVLAVLIGLFVFACVAATGGHWEPLIAFAIVLPTTPLMHRFLQ